MEIYDTELLAMFGRLEAVIASYIARLVPKIYIYQNTLILYIILVKLQKDLAKQFLRNLEIL